MMTCKVRPSTTPERWRRGVILLIAALAIGNGCSRQAEVDPVAQEQARIASVTGLAIRTFLATDSSFPLVVDKIERRWEGYFLVSLFAVGPQSGGGGLVRVNDDGTAIVVERYL